MRNSEDGRRARPAIGPRMSRAGVVLAMVAMGSVGCGGPTGNEGPDVKTYEVKGQVLLADGKPLTACQVVFVPTKSDGVRAIGAIQPDGSFTLTTKDPGDGAAEGEYKVRIDADLDTSPTLKLAYPAKYRKEDTSALVVKVDPKPNQLEPFRLK